VSRCRTSSAFSAPAPLAIDDDLEQRTVRERLRIHVVDRDGAAVDEQPRESLLAERSERRGDGGRGCGRALADRRIDQRRLARVAVAGRLVRDFHELVDLRRVRDRHRRLDDRQIEPDEEPRAVGQLRELARDDFGRLAHDLAPALAAERAADAREQQPHVIVDFGRRANRRARVAHAVLLPDGYRRRDPVDAIDVRLLHPLEKLPRVRRQRLDVAPLAFRVNRVEGQRRLPGAAHAGDDHELPDGNRDVDILQVVRARAAYDKVGGFRRGGLHSPVSWRMSKPPS